MLINAPGGGLDLSMQWNGEGFVLLSALAYACSSVMVKGYARRESPVTLSGYQFVWGGLVLIALGLLGGGRVHPSSPAALALLGYLGLLSAVAYSLWAVLLQYNPVSRVTIYGFMNPVCGVILSALLLGEQGVFGAPAAAALVLVCAGIWLVNREGPSGNKGPALQKGGVLSCRCRELYRGQAGRSQPSSSSQASAVSSSETYHAASSRMRRISVRQHVQ